MRILTGRFTIALAAILALTGFQPVLMADTLKQVGESKAMDSFNRKSEQLKSRNRDIEKWAEPGSNYAALFDKYTYGKDLISWLGGDLAGYARQDEERRKNEELVRVMLEYRPHSGSEAFIISVYVPYPRMLTAASLGLMKELNSLEPPALPVTSQEDVSVRGFPGKLSHLSTSGYALLFKLDKEVRLNIECTKCGAPDAILTFSRMLDIGRLSRKLNS